jgi:hypothetical protein
MERSYHVSQPAAVCGNFIWPLLVHDEVNKSCLVTHPFRPGGPSLVALTGNGGTLNQGGDSEVAISIIMFGPHRGTAI